jgi:hypothetical protein
VFFVFDRINKQQVSFLYVLQTIPMWLVVLFINGKNEREKKLKLIFFIYAEEWSDADSVQFKFNKLKKKNSDTQFVLLYSINFAATKWRGKKKIDTSVARVWLLSCRSFFLLLLYWLVYFIYFSIHKKEWYLPYFAEKNDALVFNEN